MVESAPYSNIGRITSDTLFVNLNECGGAWSPLLVG